MNRSKARRNQGIKQSQGRVVDLSDAAHFEKLSKKYADRLLVLHAYTTYEAACKELKQFINHVSTKPQYSSVVFLEADYEKDSLRAVTDFIDPSSIPNVSFHRGGEMLEEVRKATPSSAYQALLRLEKTIGLHSNRHAEEEQLKRQRRRSIAKLAGAGLSLVAAGLLGYKLWSRRESESGVVQEIEQINQHIKAAQKGLQGGVKRRRRRRRGGATKSDVSSSELADLYEEKQALERRLIELRAQHARSASGTSADPQVQAYNVLDDSSDEEDDD